MPQRQSRSHPRREKWQRITNSRFLASRLPTVKKHQLPSWILYIKIRTFLSQRQGFFFFWRKNVRFSIAVFLGNIKDSAFWPSRISITPL